MYDSSICKKYCPYLNGRKPRFIVTACSTHFGFRIANGHGCQGDCIMTTRHISLTSDGNVIEQWMKDNIDPVHDIVNCPCYAEHFLNETSKE